MQFEEAGLQALLARLQEIRSNGIEEIELPVETVRELLDPNGLPWHWSQEHSDYLMSWAKPRGVVLTSKWQQSKIWFRLA